MFQKIVRRSCSKLARIKLKTFPKEIGKQQNLQKLDLS
ncbi:hypothetical protein LEP1GSC088_1415 [Leptospira interrogans str. L1207]|nr:hypothetical protein LEP1GSC088_1415 [Leptospira interrogans str. L1207]